MPGQSGQSQQQMEQIAEKLVDVQELQGSAFTHIGRCKSCGWQTMQMDEDSAKKMVKAHAMVHGPELMAEINAAKAGGGGGAGGGQGQQGQQGQQQSKSQQGSQQAGQQQKPGTMSPARGHS